jgi:hypothetical protein
MLQTRVKITEEMLNSEEIQLSGYRSNYNKDFNFFYKKYLNVCDYNSAKFYAKLDVRSYACMFNKDVRRLKLTSETVCNHCNKPGKMQVDHIIPIILGGKNLLSNTQFLCHSCHIKKSTSEIKYQYIV